MMQIYKKEAADFPEPAEIDKMHWWFGVQAVNHAWDIASRDEMDERDFEEMLLAAYAAAYHWRMLGEDIHLARADMLLTHAHAHLGNAGVAAGHAVKCVAYCEHHDVSAWDLAFAYAEMGFASAAGGNREKAEAFLESAEKVAGQIPEDDRRFFIEELAVIQREIKNLKSRGLSGSRRV